MLKQHREKASKGNNRTWYFTRYTCDDFLGGRCGWVWERAVFAWACGFVPNFLEELNSHTHVLHVGMHSHWLTWPNWIATICLWLWVLWPARANTTIIIWTKPNSQLLHLLFVYSILSFVSYDCDDGKTKQVSANDYVECATYCICFVGAELSTTKKGAEPQLLQDIRSVLQMFHGGIDRGASRLTNLHLTSLAKI